MGQGNAWLLWAWCDVLVHLGPCHVLLDVHVSECAQVFVFLCMCAAGAGLRVRACAYVCAGVGMCVREHESMRDSACASGHHVCVPACVSAFYFRFVCVCVCVAVSVNVSGSGSGSVCDCVCVRMYLCVFMCPHAHLCVYVCVCVHVLLRSSFWQLSPPLKAL